MTSAEHHLSPFPFSFEGPVERFAVGKSRVVSYCVLFLPEHLAATDAFLGRQTVRVEGEIADVPVMGAWMPTGDGRHWFIVSKEVFKTADIQMGDPVQMRFRLDDPERVVVPEALAGALGRDPVASQTWDGLTAGKRRAFAHHVATAKTDRTLDKRLGTAMALLRSGKGAFPRKTPSGDSRTR